MLLLPVAAGAATVPRAARESPSRPVAMILAAWELARMLAPATAPCTMEPDESARQAASLPSSQQPPVWPVIERLASLALAVRVAPQSASRFPNGRPEGSIDPMESLSLARRPLPT